MALWLGTEVVDLAFVDVPSVVGIIILIVKALADLELHLSAPGLLGAVLAASVLVGCNLAVAKGVLRRWQSWQLVGSLMILRHQL